MRLRMAETVLSQRTNRFSLVLESLFDDYNQQAVLRTADCFGIQNVHVVASTKTKQRTHVSGSITKNVMPYLTVHKHDTTTQCIEALRSSGHEIWATDLSPGAMKLDDPTLVIPPKLAVVFGRELDGCSNEILEAADKRVFIPIYGFAESLNLSVAASLVMQTLFTKCPEARGNLLDSEKAELREKWYEILGRGSEHQKELFKSFLVNPPPPLDDIRRLDKVSFTKEKPRHSKQPDAQAEPSTKQPKAKRPATATEDGAEPPPKKQKRQEEQ